MSTLLQTVSRIDEPWGNEKQFLDAVEYQA
jgi:hypothetical protein